jgi:hypothetical protein
MHSRWCIMSFLWTWVKTMFNRLFFAYSTIHKKYISRTWNPNIPKHKTQIPKHKTQIFQNIKPNIPKYKIILCEKSFEVVFPIESRELELLCIWWHSHGSWPCPHSSSATWCGISCVFMAGQCFSCSFAPLSLNSYHSLTQQLLYNSIDHTVFEAKNRRPFTSRSTCCLSSSFMADCYLFNATGIRRRLLRQHKIQWHQPMR